MALSKRERVLAGMTVALLAAGGVWLVASTLGGPISRRRAQHENLRQEVEQKSRRVEAAQKARRQLDDWRRRSLPSDLEIARSLYKNWLLELVTEADLEDAKVEPGQVRANRDNYWALPFTVRARGKLDELTDFLYEFYSKGYLHKIRQLSIKPREGSSNLDLTMAIEALSLPDANSQDQLPDEPSIWLVDSSLSDYAGIGRRNLFAAYQPPPPPVVQREPPDRPPSFDPSTYAFLTAIVEVDGQPQLWLKARTTGDMYTLKEGDNFEVGPVRGTVLEIHQRAAEVEINGQRKWIALGKSLHDPAELPE